MGLGEHWKGGESVRIFVLFWFFGFYFRMSIMSGTLTFRPFSKRWIYSENFKTISVVLNFTRSVKILLWVTFLAETSKDLEIIIGNKSNIDDNLILSFLKKEINLMNMQIN